jgi:hypothetical protein
MFFEGPIKLNMYFLCVRWWFLIYLVLLFLRKSDTKFLLASLKTLACCDIYLKPPTSVKLAPWKIQTIGASRERTDSIF